MLLPDKPLEAQNYVVFLDDAYLYGVFAAVLFKNLLGVFG